MRRIGGGGGGEGEGGGEGRGGGGGGGGGERARGGGRTRTRTRRRWFYDVAEVKHFWKVVESSSCRRVDLESRCCFCCLLFGFICLFAFLFFVFFCFLNNNKKKTTATTNSSFIYLFILLAMLSFFGAYSNSTEIAYIFIHLWIDSIWELKERQEQQVLPVERYLQT